MPCYGPSVIYTTYPKGCATTEPSPFSLPLSSDNIIYTGPNLPYTGIQTDDELTDALQKIDQKIGIGISKLRSYTVAGVPSASTEGAGTLIYVTNESGGAIPAFSDGTNWRRVTDRAIIT